MHYLDDFLTMGKAGSSECQQNLDLIIASCRQVGVPLAIKIQKMEGPSAILDFLGITLDSIRMEIRLPPSKLFAIKVLIRECAHKRRSKKRDLLSFIGKLAHACKVVTPGRIFLRRMIDTSCQVRRLDHWIVLNSDFKSDLHWWSVFDNLEW